MPEDDPSRVDRAGYADFFARAAHDLRSPLGVVLHALQALESDLATTATTDQRTLFKLGARGIRRLEAFVDRLQVVSDLESGRLEPALQRCDLRDVVRRSVDAILSTEPRSEVTVAFDPPPMEYPISVDPRLFGRAVAELVSNAMAHARRSVRVVLETTGAAFGVVVEDDGEGVSREAAATLYQRFVVRTTRGGLGLGLSVARDILVAHGGGVTSGESTLPPGRPGTVGARFTLFVPAFVSS